MDNRIFEEKNFDPDEHKKDKWLSRVGKGVLIAFGIVALIVQGTNSSSKTQ